MVRSEENWVRSEGALVAARSDSATSRAAGRSPVVRDLPPAVTHSHRNVDIAAPYAQGQVFQGALQGSPNSSQGHTSNINCRLYL
jgi:hypothetical protein